jgi:tRNA (guanine-N7-)-methyltransferase
MLSERSLAEETEKQRRVYGRRLGRPLNAARQGAIDSLLPVLSVPEGQVREDGTLRPADLFGHNAPLWIELGFGNGEHLAALTRRRPDHNYIGAEPFINGMAALLKALGEQVPLPGNIRLWMDDGLKIINSLAADTVQGIYILNPDPWPKKRHHKRRIVNDHTLDAYARVLKPGGTLTMTTDVDELAEWMAEKAINHPQFEWTAETQSDWTTPPPDWIETRYEQKGRAAGRRQSYLVFRRA